MNIPDMVANDLAAAGMPKSQDACCAIAARIAVALEDREWTDALVIEAAASMAAGVFGPAFDRADYGQKSAWIDMCERELRKAII